MMERREEQPTYYTGMNEKEEVVGGPELEGSKGIID